MIAEPLCCDALMPNCTGSSIRDFISAADRSPMPDDAVALFNDGTETTGGLVYVPPAQAVSARA